MKGKKRWFIVLGILLLVGGVSAWTMGWFDSNPANDPEVIRLQEKMATMHQQRSAGKLSDTDRTRMREQFHREVQQLSEEQRRALFHKGHQAMREAMRKRIDEYFTLPPEKRTAALDRAIDEMERFRREREAQGPPPGRGHPGDSPPEGGPPGAGRRRGPRPAGSQDMAERRQQRMKRMLDSTTPEGRAKMHAYHEAMRERRKERGLPEHPFGPRRGTIATLRVPLPWSYRLPHWQSQWHTGDVGF